MRKLTEKFMKWCAEDTPAARFERSIAQGIIGVVAGLVTIAATNNPVIGTVVAPTVMAIFSPIQAAIGKNVGNEPKN